MKLSRSEKQYFTDCSLELLKSEIVQRMGTFIQHANVSCLEHSISVAYYSYWLCRKLNLNVDCRSIIRGALLHDFFLYDWHVTKNPKGLHGFKHPLTALENAEEHFSLNDCEKEIIVRHMWPLTLTPPKCREALIVSLSDKFCSIIEILRIYPALISR
ncbi:HD domain-containing protein [Caproiciproducens sp. CPB-2]|uniref:HD domain-containing protein n=1 Tax=Caproiciproducens sp. CPB-2 TaxID=3030017 RepID=UPI0023DA1F0D|nr:HD domain-containing protein [Caproiciproducens sp. CPB-2]MDF1495499.1 HD domain-containing protein [Caproiciproducens sp. CPB-2]